MPRSSGRRTGPDAAPAEAAGRVHAPHRVRRLAFDVTGQNLSGAYDSSQSGWYVQAVYEFMQRWRAGLRYDSMDSGHPDIGLVSSGLLPPAAFPALLPASPDRTTLMVDWSLSEFSRLRAQYAWDDARAYNA